MVEKPPSRPLPHTCLLFHYERESWRDERLREGHARGHTHAHTHTHTHREFLKRESERETVCYCAFCESYKSEREIDAFFFLLCDERTYPNEREREEL